MRARWSRAIALAFAVAGCERNGPGASGKPSGAGGAASTEGEVRLEPMDPLEAQAWDRAKDGDDDDRMRLADRVGCTGLRERAQEPGRRSTAIRAMAYCNDFSELPWLTSIAASGDESEGLEALDAIVDQAALPRRATDPEDADDLSAGCHALLALSRDHGRSRARRVIAIRALRMLAPRGCVKRDEIPTEFDANDDSGRP